MKNSLIDLLRSFHKTELEWIKEIHETLRSSFMDRFFWTWNYVDSFTFAMILITITWYLIDRKIGIKLFYVFILSSILNTFFKNYFGLPRPCQIDLSVGLLCPKSFGFPSGAAQTATLVAGIICIESKKWIHRILGILFALFLCFSRVYLGVHFFSDVAGGLIVGGFLLFVYAKLFPLFENRWRVWAFLFPFFPLLVEKKSPLFFFWTTLGVALGILFDHPKQIKKYSIRFAQFLSVVIGLLLLGRATVIFPHALGFIHLLSGFWLSFLGKRFIQKN